MRTGLETSPDKTIIRLIENLKSGMLKVLNMSVEELHKADGKACPPSQAVQLNFMLLETFRAEALRRGLDYDTIGPNTREIEDAWLEARLKDS